MDSLSRIGSGLGIPMYTDECTINVERISYARILVEIDVTRELPHVVKAMDPNGKLFEQEVVYDWVPEYCHTCLQVGHRCKPVQKQLQTAIPKAKAAKPKQAWLEKIATTGAQEGGLPT